MQLLFAFLISEGSQKQQYYAPCHTKGNLCHSLLLFFQPTGKGWVDDGGNAKISFSFCLIFFPLGKLSTLSEWHWVLLFFLSSKRIIYNFGAINFRWQFFPMRGTVWKKIYYGIFLNDKHKQDFTEKFYTTGCDKKMLS